MAQLSTVQFLKNDGFATGLTPSVTITEAKTGIVRGTFAMTEISAGNYIYDYIDGSDEMLFFFNYDAGTDDVINRYQGNTNRIEVSRGGGGGITTIKNNVIHKEQMKEIAEMVVKMLPAPINNILDTKNIEERLGLIEMKMNESDVEFDYDTILSSVEDSALKISKEIKTIKIPKQDDTKVIKAIKSVESKIDKIDTQQVEIKEHTKKIKTKKERKIDDLVEAIEDMGTQKELDDMIEQPEKEFNDFISSLEKDD